MDKLRIIMLLFMAGIAVHWFWHYFIDPSQDETVTYIKPKPKGFKMKNQTIFYEVISEFEVKPRRCLQDVLLAINYNSPLYSNAELLRTFFEPVFGKVVFCGEKENKTYGVIKVPEKNGYQGYACVIAAIKLYPDFTGYIHSNDDVLINWWNLVDFDKTKVWLGTDLIIGDLYRFGEKPPSTWHWWRDERAGVHCEKSINNLEALRNTSEGREFNLDHYLKQYYKNVNNSKACIHSDSDFFYIPSHLAEVYARISDVFIKNKLFLEVAVPVALAFLVNETNSINLNGSYYNRQYKYSEKYFSGEAFYETYSLDLNFSHPFKFFGSMQAANRKFFKEVVMQHGISVRKDCQRNS